MARPGCGGEAELLGLPLDLPLAAGGDHLAVVDDDDPVGEALNLVELVAGEKHAHAVRAQGAMTSRTVMRPDGSTPAVGSSRKTHARSADER